MAYFSTLLLVVATCANGLYIPERKPPRFGCTKKDEYKSRTGNHCNGAYCDENGQLITWDDWNCGSKTTTSTEITTEWKTTAWKTTTSCTTEDEYNDKDGTYCYGAYCENGVLIDWQDWNCGSTTTPSTTEWKQPGNGCNIEDEYADQDGNHCYGAYCDESGRLIPWDNWNC